MVDDNRPLHMLEDPQIRADLENLVQALKDRLNELCSDTYTGWSAYELAEALAGRSTQHLQPQQAVRKVLAALVDNPRSPNIWGTPLGRAVAYWGTGDPDVVSRACAAAALGCTRQNVSLMIRDGRLSEPANAGTNDLVSTASLAHAMRRKYPLGG